MLFDYDKNPQLKHEITLKELVEKIGIPAIFEKTTVDQATQKSLIDFFELDRLCDTENKFLWFFRRRLNMFYPVFKDQLEMWADRKTKAWFFDNVKKERRTHEGSSTLDEETATELTRVLERIHKDIFEGKATTENETTGTQTRSDTSQTETSDSYTDTDSGKNRSFAFAYPESNYQGGVIPYDIDNNPSVEFISTQADTISKSTSDHEGSSGTESSSESSGTENTTGNSVTDTKNTTDQTTNDTGTDTGTGTRAQETTDSWTETEEHDGPDINYLAQQLLAQIPATDFFAEFTRKLSPCFQSTYLIDELLEESEE